MCILWRTATQFVCAGAGIPIFVVGTAERGVKFVDKNQDMSPMRSTVVSGKLNPLEQRYIQFTEATVRQPRRWGSYWG